MSPDFGVMIACHRHDYYLAKGCCASIRHFMGDVPIVLLVDGEFSTRDIEDTYGATTLRRSAISHSRIRAQSFGWGLTKMVAFWNSPWATFLVLDADTAVWGDVRKYASFDAADMVVDRHIEDLFPSAQEALLGQFLARRERDPKLHAHVERWYFHPGLLRRHDPTFPLGETIGRLFCSGAVLARRNALDRDDYLSVLDAARSVSGLFGPGEMGLLNYLAFKAEASGMLRLQQEADLQTMVHMIGDVEMAERFPIAKREPLQEIDRPTILHWSGWQKPLVRDRRPRATVMNFFRHRFLSDAGYSRRQAKSILAAEDYSRVIRFGALSNLGSRKFGT